MICKITGNYTHCRAILRWNLNTMRLTSYKTKRHEHKIFVLIRAVYVWSVIVGSFAKHLESANTMFSFVWWIVGFYWVTAGGDSLVTEAPQLYWSVSFLSKNLGILCLNTLLTVVFFYFLFNFIWQAFGYISGFWCGICCDLRCCCLPYRDCSLLLPAVHNRYPLCCHRSGIYHLTILKCLVF